jgi:hypothetical protein
MLKPLAPSPSAPHPADDFVPGNDRQQRLRQFAGDEVKAGAAHPASLDLQQDLAGDRDRAGPLFQA